MQCVAGASGTQCHPVAVLATAWQSTTARPVAPCRLCGAKSATSSSKHTFHTHRIKQSCQRRALTTCAAAVAETTMETVTVDLGDRSYPIYIGPGLLTSPDSLLAQHIAGKQALIVTNETIAPLYLDAYVVPHRSKSPHADAQMHQGHWSGQRSAHSGAARRRSTQVDRGALVMSSMMSCLHRRV